MGKNTTSHINEIMNRDVASTVNIPTPENASRHLGLNNSMAYLEADAFIGNPYALLGAVLEVRNVEGKCPEGFYASGGMLNFSESKIPGFKIDENSGIKEPIKRQSIIVDQKLAGGISFLNYLSAQLERETSFSLLVFDQAAGLVDRDHDSWNGGLKKWKSENAALMADPGVCWLFAVIGFVQKYIVRRKYYKFNAGAKGGAYGISLNGELYTSTEDYSLDIRYGLQPVVLKRPEVSKNLEAVSRSLAPSASLSDLQFLERLTLSV